jgi:hypothetical protein
VIILIIFGKQYLLRSSSLSSFLQSSTISSVQIFSSAPCSQSPSICVLTLKQRPSYTLTKL